MNTRGRRTAVLQRQLCVFVDILGFSEKIKSSKGSLQAEFEKLYEAYSSALNVLKEGRDLKGTKKFRWEMRTFTDNVLLAFPFKTDDGEMEVGFLYDDISAFQMELATRGYFTRGGFSVGELHLDSKMIFGPALLEAYELESKAARDPRIVLSKEVEQLVLTHIGYYFPPKSAPQNEFFLRDSDGQVFINYLESVMLTVDEVGPERVNERLELHREHVEKGLRDNRQVPAVWSKFRWLASYHNWFISGIRRKGFRPGANPISSTLFASKPSRLV